MRSINLKRPASLLVITILIVLMTAASSVALGARRGGSQLETVSHPQVPNAPGCTLVGPRFGLELNTVSVDNVNRFKSIAMEKEIFACRDAGSVILQYRDVETFIELVESDHGVLLQTPLVEIATCDKDFTQSTVSCTTNPLPLSPSVKQPLLGCQANSVGAPEDPVVMNTAVLGNFVKTIKVEKEWYTCDTAAGVRIRDVYLFSEVLEAYQRDPVTRTRSLSPFAHKFIGIVCTKDELKGAITGCSRFATH